jgi:hypothetical protein
MDLTNYARIIRSPGACPEFSQNLITGEPVAACRCHR